MDFTRRVISIWCTAVASTAYAQPAHSPPVDVPIQQLGGAFRLIGKLGLPLGTVVRIQGIVVSGPSKGYDDGPNLLVQRIDDRFIMENIRIKLEPYFGSFGDVEASADHRLPSLEDRMTYELEGYETGGIVGVPPMAYERAGIDLQSQIGTSFHSWFVAYKGKTTAAIRFSPSEFIGRSALLVGTARSKDGQSFIVDEGWELLTDPNAAWPSHIEGKRTEAFGVIRAGTSDTSFKVEGGVTRLVRLEDQIGREVALRGTAWSMNGRWWFNYRGVDLYVDGMEKMSGWTGEHHGRSVMIRGTLARELLPRIDKITLKADPDREECFIVRSPSWEPLDGLLGPEQPGREGH